MNGDELPLYQNTVRDKTTPGQEFSRTSWHTVSRNTPDPKRRISGVPSVSCAKSNSVRNDVFIVEPCRAIGSHTGVAVRYWTITLQVFDKGRVRLPPPPCHEYYVDPPSTSGIYPGRRHPRTSGPS